MEGLELGLVDTVTVLLSVLVVVGGVLSLGHLFLRNQRTMNVNMGVLVARMPNLAKESQKSSFAVNIALPLAKISQQVHVLGTIERIKRIIHAPKVVGCIAGHWSRHSGNLANQRSWPH